MTEKTEALARSFSLMPTSLGEAMELARMIADSDFAPKDYKGKPANVVIAIQMGVDIGLKPMQALQNIAVINGRPSIYGDAALALVQRSGICEKFKEYFEGEKGKDTWTAVCEMKRTGWPDLIVRKFSVADAKKANLWGKAGPWTTYEDRMLQMRARGFTVRDGASDVLMGLILAEEAMDYPTAIDATIVSSVPVTLFDKLPEGLRDNLEKAFETLSMSGAQRLAKINEFLGGDGVDLEAEAVKLLEWCRDEYAKRKTGQPRKAKESDNGKSTSAPAGQVGISPATEPAGPSPAGPVEQRVDPSVGARGSDVRSAGTEAPSRGSGQEAPASSSQHWPDFKETAKAKEPLTAKDIPFTELF